MASTCCRTVTLDAVKSVSSSEYSPLFLYYDCYHDEDVVLKKDVRFGCVSGDRSLWESWHAVLLLRGSGVGLEVRAPRSQYIEDSAHKSIPWDMLFRK